MMNIDFVVLWVDGNDPEWQQQKCQYQTDTIDDSNSVNRFRDWGLMRYWFRSVETFCPWVRKVHFVTWGHTPEWLNLECTKLNHVRHEDYIPKQYLPTFNANTIEMNIHRISDLAEHFVFFNDDMFLLRPLSEEVFFHDGLPCTYGAEIPIVYSGEAGIWQHLICNDMRVINNHFQKAVQSRKNRRKYLDKAYKWKDNIRTLILECLYPEGFLGFKNLHAPAAFIKSTFEEIWNAEELLLDQTSRHKFRSHEDVNQWLSIWWQIASGAFNPYDIDNVVDDISIDTIKTMSRIIKTQSHDMICLNDSGDLMEYDILAEKLQSAFQVILPKKSVFEL